MEQLFEVVFKPIAGYKHVVTESPSGELIVRLVPNLMGEGKAHFFTKITKQDRERVKAWLEGREGETEREKTFLELVKEAIHNINYDYWIATIEPSVENGEIYYDKNKDVGCEFSCLEWKEMAEKYAPERCSRLASLDELFIWYALRIVYKFWTLDYIANGSSSSGNYMNALDSKPCIEKTGTVFCGGYEDGQGNTYKIVTTESGFTFVGGCIQGDFVPKPVTELWRDEYDSFTAYRSVGVLVLTE